VPFERVTELARGQFFRPRRIRVRKNVKVNCAKDSFWGLFSSTPFSGPLCYGHLWTSSVNQRCRSSNSVWERRARTITSATLDPERHARHGVGLLSASQRHPAKLHSRVASSIASFVRDGGPAADRQSGGHLSFWSRNLHAIASGPRTADSGARSTWKNNSTRICFSRQPAIINLKWIAKAIKPLRAGDAARWTHAPDVAPAIESSARHT